MGTPVSSYHKQLETSLSATYIQADMGKGKGRTMTTTDTEISRVLGIGMAQNYINTKDWIPQAGLGDRAVQDVTQLKDSLPLLSNPTNANAFKTAFVEHYQQQASLTAQS